MAQHYRDNGAIGALLDEYERALKDLQSVINGISQKDLVAIVDHQTKNPDCRSIQTILTHVVRAGYNYVIDIRNSLGERLPLAPYEKFDSAQEYNIALREMFAYNELLFKEYPTLKIEEHDPSKKILVRWGQRFDVEQLLEHAIVHILRHRRQIERFLIQLDQKEI